MRLKNIVAVSGEAGLFELVSTKNNGLILKNPKNGKTGFYSMRKHQFTPLESVGIYTMTDTVDIKDIFEAMLAKEPELPVVSHKESGSALSSYFGEILPDYDRDRVYVGDIKKVVKWYRSLEDLGFLHQEELSDEEE